MLARRVTVHETSDRIDEGVRVQRESVVPVLRECEACGAVSHPRRHAWMTTTSVARDLPFSCSDRRGR